MAYFNEENTVEQMLINAAGKCGWIYVEPQEVPRLPDEVLVTEWLVTALRRLNPITEDQAAQVVYRLRAACSIGTSIRALSIMTNISTGVPCGFVGLGVSPK